MKDKLPEIPKEKQKLFSRINRLGRQIGAVERAASLGLENGSARMTHTTRPSSLRDASVAFDSIPLQPLT
jgi:hypothetical protein